MAALLALCGIGNCAGAGSSLHPRCAEKHIAGYAQAMRVPAAISVLVIAGAFVFLHTGSRASAQCARYGAAVRDGLSVWPPGTRCSGGEPVRTNVKFDTTMLLVIPSVALLAFGAAAIVRPARRAHGPAPSTSSE